MKKCNKCNEEKPLTEFCKNKSRKDGLAYRCKSCNKEYNKTNYLNNKERYKTHYQNNKEQIKEYNKECNTCNEEKPLTEFYKNKASKDGKTNICIVCSKNKGNNRYLNNKEQYKINTKRWRENNPIVSKSYGKKFKENNPNYHKDWAKTYKQNNPQYKLVCLLRNRISVSIKNKTNSSINLLGCDIETYYNYLEKQFSKNMTWDNHGEIWEIDHIKPINTFDLEDENEQFQAFNYKNTRPLYVSENRSRPKDGRDLI